MSDSASHYLERQIAHLGSLEVDEVPFAAIRILRALRADPRISVHLDDLKAEAASNLRAVRSAEAERLRAARELAERGKQYFVGATNAGWDGGQAWTHLQNHLLDPGSLPVFPEWSSVGDLSPSFAPRSKEIASTVEYLFGCADRALSAEKEGLKMLRCDARELERAANLALRLFRVADRSDPAVALDRAERALAPMTTDAPTDTQILDWELINAGSPALDLASRAAGPIADNDGMSGGIGGSPIATAAANGLARAMVVAMEEILRRVGGTASRLGLLQRFKMRAELLDRDRLALLVKGVADPEHRLRDEVARFLFDQGLNPLTEVSLGNIRADIADVHGVEAFYLEAKQYTKGPRQAAIAAARQVWGSAARFVGPPYDLREAFLVIFRRGGPHLVVPEGAVVASGLKLYVRVVDIGPDSGSGQKARPVAVTADDLAPEVASELDEILEANE